MSRMIFILFFFFSVELIAQQQFKIERLPFNSDVYNEMSPVIYKNGIVYSSNEKNNVVAVTVDQNNNYPFNLYFVEKKEKKWGRPSLFSTNLSSRLSESSATFSDDYRTMYLTRTHMANLKPSQLQKQDSAIKFGIYQATSNKKDWFLTKQFAYNDEDYKFIFPSLSSDGTKLFFASNMPGGFGGYDIYYCEGKSGRWSKPQNLGPTINTSENEVSPFIHLNGRLYFSSRGHSGIGGLDIFYSEIINGEWIKPVNLPRPFNTRKDEFSYVLSPSMDTGYFASNRLGTDDIYIFASSFPGFETCPNQIDETYCYEFNETGSIDIDTTNLNYEWDFGDGSKSRTVIADHCYGSIGTYHVALNVIDTLTGETYFSEAEYELVVESAEQPYINVEDTVMVNQKTKFDATGSYIKSFVPKNYFWDFGDGNVETGIEIDYSYNSPGIYYIRLGITAEEETSSKKETNNTKKACSQKKIIVLQNEK